MGGACRARLPAQVLNVALCGIKRMLALAAVMLLPPNQPALSPHFTAPSRPRKVLSKKWWQSTAPSHSPRSPTPVRRWWQSLLTWPRPPMACAPCTCPTTAACSCGRASCASTTRPGLATQVGGAGRCTARGPACSGGGLLLLLSGSQRRILDLIRETVWVNPPNLPVPQLLCITSYLSTSDEQLTAALHHL